MKYIYLSTFLSGTNDLVLQTLKSNLTDFEEVLGLDGLVVYKTSSDISTIKQLRYLNNSFIVINQISLDSLNPEKRSNAFDVLYDYILHTSLDIYKKPLHDMNATKLRIVASIENQNVSYKNRRLEEKLATEFNLDIDRLNPDIEFWFLQRSEGYAFALFRLTNTSKSEHRAKGQLRAELAALMCLLSEPSSSDVCIDPFAGYGTILFERAHLPYKKLIAYEREIKADYSGKNIEVYNADFFENKLSDACVTKIITDPPWGFYNTDLDVETFYTRLLVEFSRLLLKNGLAIILVHREIDFKRYLQNTRLVIKERYDILVSGKKASIYKLVYT